MSRKAHRLTVRLTGNELRLCRGEHSRTSLCRYEHFVRDVPRRDAPLTIGEDHGFTRPRSADPVAPHQPPNQPPRDAA